MVSLANTSYQGQYIFGGSQTGTLPFTISSSTTPATATYNGDATVNSLVTPNGQRIQLNVPGDQIFTASGSTNVLGVLNQLIADFGTGQASASSVADATALGDALNFVSQQRVIVDNSLTRLTAATDAASNEQTQLTAAQTDLMQADVAKIATQLSLSKTQQTALESVIAQLGRRKPFRQAERLEERACELRAVAQQVLAIGRIYTRRKDRHHCFPLFAFSGMLRAGRG